jgi:hypothetical protein
MTHLYRTISLIANIFVLVPLVYASAFICIIFHLLNNFTYHTFNEFEFPIEQCREQLENKFSIQNLEILEFMYERHPLFCKLIYLITHPIASCLINAHNSVKTIVY